MLPDGSDLRYLLLAVLISIRDEGDPGLQNRLVPIDPFSKFDDRSKYCSFGRWVKMSGRGPVKLLFAKERSWRFWRLDQEAGMVPVSLLSLSENWTREQARAAPIWGAPCNLFASSISPTTAFSLHSTPYHMQCSDDVFHPLGHGDGESGSRGSMHWERLTSC